MGWFRNAFLSLSVCAVLQPLTALADGELHLSPAPARTLSITPAVLLGRSTLNTAGCTCHFGEEYMTDLEFAARMLGSASRDKRLVIGFELRQLFGHIDNRDAFDMLGTKLGLRLESHPSWAYEPSFGVAWFFGDTIVSRHHDEQFNGNSLAFSTSAMLGPARWLVELSGGNYHEGPGFIALSRRAGDELLSVRSVKIGAEFPFVLPAPDWLMTFPSSEPQ